MELGEWADVFHGCVCRSVLIVTVCCYHVREGVCKSWLLWGWGSCDLVLLDVVLFVVVVCVVGLGEREVGSVLLCWLLWSCLWGLVLSVPWSLLWGGGGLGAERGKRRVGCLFIVLESTIMLCCGDEISCAVVKVRNIILCLL